MRHWRHLQEENRQECSATCSTRQVKILSIFFLSAAWQLKKEKDNWTSLQNKEAVVPAVSKKQTKTVSAQQGSFRRFNRKLAVHQKCIRGFGTNKEHHPAVVLKFCSCPTMHSMLLRKKFSIKMSFGIVTTITFGSGYFFFFFSQTRWSKLVFLYWMSKTWKKKEPPYSMIFRCHMMFSCKGLRYAC